MHCCFHCYELNYSMLALIGNKVVLLKIFFHFLCGKIFNRNWLYESNYSLLKIPLLARINFLCLLCENSCYFPSVHLFTL